MRGVAQRAIADGSGLRGRRAERSCPAILRSPRGAPLVAGPAVDVEISSAQRDLFARGEQAIDARYAVVDAPVEHVARGAGRRRDGAGRRLHVPVGDPLERSGERLEDAIELDAHLIRQRPARVVVRRRRRRARIRDHVRDDPAARTCRARAAGTPAPSSRRTSRPDSVLPADLESRVARCTATFTSRSALTNLIAVRKSGWLDGMM